MGTLKTLCLDLSLIDPYDHHIVFGSLESSLQNNLASGYQLRLKGLLSRLKAFSKLTKNVSCSDQPPSKGGVGAYPYS